MAVPFSNTTLRVPHGFPNLLEALSREVLRHQPKDIYGFAEKYFEELIKKREETGTEDLAQLCSRLNDRYYNNKAYCGPDLNSSKEEQQDAAVTIQSEYRRYQAQKDTDDLWKHEAALKIQSSYRGYRVRKGVQPRKSTPESPKSGANASESTEPIPPISTEQVTTSDDTELQPVESAPISTDNLETEPEASVASEPNAKEHLAATRIQANYRGHLARCNYRLRRPSAPPTESPPPTPEQREQAVVPDQTVEGEIESILINPLGATSEDNQYDNEAQAEVEEEEEEEQQQQQQSVQDNSLEATVEPEDQEVIEPVEDTSTEINSEEQSVVVTTDTFETTSDSKPEPEPEPEEEEEDSSAAVTVDPELTTGEDNQAPEVIENKSDIEEEN